MFKLKDYFTYFVILLTLVIIVRASYAQTWDMQRIKSVRKVRATVLNADPYYNMLTLKVVTNAHIGEYKTGWCTADSDTTIFHKTQRLSLSDLHKGDDIYVGGVIYTNSKKSCRFIEVINRKNKHDKTRKNNNYENKIYSSSSQPKVSSKSILVR